MHSTIGQSVGQNPMYYYCAGKLPLPDMTVRHLITRKGKEQCLTLFYMTKKDFPFINRL